MATSGPNFSSNTPFNYGWSNPTYIYSDDGTYTNTSGASLSPDLSLMLTKDGSIRVGSSYSHTLTTVVATYTSGSSSNLWGSSWSPAEINASTFGCFIDTSDETLSTTGYGFSIPTGASINGIEVRIEGYCASARLGVKHYIDFISITVTYTEGGGGASAVPAIMNQYRQRRA